MRIGPYLMIVGLCWPSSAQAEQFWVAYEGDDYPENAGWRRRFGDENGPNHGGASRSIENGVLRLDSLVNDQVFDFYEVNRPVSLAASEYFVAEWSVRVDPSSEPDDVGVAIGSATPAGMVSFQFAPDGVEAYWENHLTIPVDLTAFREFRFVSNDLASYDLFIDDALVHHGSFEVFSAMEWFVNFGDGTQGASSLSEWDFYRFGVIPEPSAGVVIGVLGLAQCGTRRRC